jgi:hypothetical protein
MSELSKNEKVVAKMVEIRDKREALKREFEEKDKALLEQYAKGESFLMQQLNEMGEGASMKLSTGTVYTTQNLKASVADKGVLAEFIRETGEVELLQFRVSTTVLKDYMTNNDGALPPGVNASVERTINIRRPSAK